MARQWYEREAIKEVWSVKTLQRNISSQYYYRILQSAHPQRVADEMHKLTAPMQDKDEFIKNPVVVEFLGLSPNTDYTESTLEKAIITNLQKFLMELGKGYAFVARQQHIRTEKEEYYIDLVFYNYLLKCFVLIDLKTSMNEIDEYLIEEWDGNNSSFALTVVDDQPTVSADACREVKDVIGSFSTTFGVSGNYNRNMNMKNGIDHINGNVIYPGETFSVNSVLEPWTESNGWYSAGTYVNGRVENSLGGGICQVSTTLYNAVLRAELEVTERAPHSMNVGYVDLAADAALAGTWKDLKVTNNTDVPVYIEGIYDPKGKLTFNLYGKETRDPGRELKFVSETISTNYPSEVRKEDPSKPVGYRAVTVQGHIGYVAKLWKEIYENGKLVDKQLVNTSTYQSSPIYVTYGTGGEEKPEESTDEKPDKKPESEETTKKKKEEQTTTKKKKAEQEPATEATTKKTQEEE